METNTSRRKAHRNVSLFAAILLLPAMAYSQKTARHEMNKTNNTSAMETTINKEVIRKVYEAMNTRNVAFFQSVIAEEYTSVTGTKGSAGFYEPIVALTKALPDIQWKVEELIAEDDKVVVKQKITGTQTGQFQYIAPTGNAIVSDGIAIYTFRNGKITSSQVNTDRLGFLQQLDVLPVDLSTLQVNKEEVNFIDKFFVPAAAKKEFLERMEINRSFIKSLPGFIEDAAYVYTDENNNLICVTVARWKNQEAFAKAKEAVQAEYRKQGFDAAEMFKRLNITADRGVYTQMVN